MPMISARLAVQSTARLARSGSHERAVHRPPPAPGAAVRSRAGNGSARAHRPS